MFTDVESYPNVGNLISFNGVERKIDFKAIFAEAASKGYKLNKSELNTFKYKYLLLYEGAYYKLGLVDASYSIIDDGEEASVFCEHGSFRSSLVINNSLGICVVMPIRIENPEESLQDKIIIEVNTDEA